VIATYVNPGYPGFSAYPIYQYAPCDPKSDAHALHKAFKGLGTDEKVVIQILANRSKFQLNEINNEYKIQSAGHNTLEHALKKEISGDFLKLALSIVTPTLILKKDNLRSAVVGLGTRESTLIDVLLQSTNAERAEIASDEKMRAAVIDDVSGDFKRVIEELFQARRPEFGSIAPEQAEEIAHRFYKAGEGKLGTDEKEFTRIILENSIEALHQVSHAYKQKHKHGLKKAIASETSGDYKAILTALITPRHKYFAKRLHHAMKGAGTEERVLNYVFGILDRGELQFVAEAYQAKFKKPLADAIIGDTSGDYKKLLLALL